MEENVIKIKDGRTINVNVSVKNIHVCEDDYILKPAKCSCKNGKYLATIIDDSAITWGENIDAKAKLYDEKTKNVAKKFNEKKNL